MPDSPADLPLGLGIRCTAPQPSLLCPCCSSFSQSSPCEMSCLVVYQEALISHTSFSPAPFFPFPQLERTPVDSVIAPFLLTLLLHQEKSAGPAASS